MERVSSSPSNSTAPTKAGKQGSAKKPFMIRTSREGAYIPVVSQGDSYPAATSSSAVSQSPFLSPGEAADGLTLMTSPSGPSSPGPIHALTNSTMEELDVEQSDHTDEHRTSSSSASLERLLRAKEMEVARLRRTVQELSAQLSAAFQTLDARADAAAELQEMKDTNAVEEERRDNEVRTVRLEMLESRVKLRSMEEQLAAKYDEDVQTKATELLATHTKDVHDANFELLREKLLLAQEVTTSRAQYKALQDSYQKLRRETDLDVDAKKELLQRSVQQKSQIASLRQQVKVCEDNLNAVVGEYDRKLAEQERLHKTIVDTLTKERDDARRDAMLLKRDLNKVRTSATTVLSQRSELDDFFYAALDEVRQRAVEERRHVLMAGGGEQTNTALDAQNGTFSPAHTATSLLRLESPERLRITGEPGGAGNASAEWTLDRKGFPKRAAAAATARQGGGTASGSFSSSALPPVAASSRGPRSAPPAAPLDGTGTLVSVPSATPAYLRTTVDASASPPLPSQAHGGRSKSPGLHSPSSTQGPFRLGGTGGAEGGVTNLDTVTSVKAATARSNGSTSPRQTLPALRSLPKPAIWKDATAVADVASLSWADKERVIQLLFKRIKTEGQRKAKSTAKEESETRSQSKKRSPQFDTDAASSTFLT